MVSALNLVSELLPLPLPIETQVPLVEEERKQIVHQRKLWSAHLYSLAPLLHEVIHRLSLATYPSVSHSLRRMCVSLSDLSAPLALLVAKEVLDLVLQTHRLDQKVAAAKEEAKEASKAEDSKASSSCTAAGRSNSYFASPQTVRILNMVSSLLTHGPTKHAVLHLLSGGSSTLAHCPTKTEEKYTALINIWCSILNCPPLNHPSSHDQQHISVQESLLSLLISVVDCRISMLDPEVNEG